MNLVIATAKRPRRGLCAWRFAHSLFLGTACAAVAVLATATTATAQRKVLQARPPANAEQIDVFEENAEDSVQVGPRVHMPISINIDRHLRKAQGFLGRSKFTSAFQVLEDVIEGRTLTEEDGLKPEEPGRATTEEMAWDMNSARGAVFSEDERIYRPVRRLCHELLATMPEEGLAAYRAQYEVEAQRALDDATARTDVTAVEEVFERFFVTLTAARALELAGDARMDRGQFRAALQNYTMLLEAYPRASHAEAGIDEAYVQLKVALCFTQLGDAQAASAALSDLEDAYPDRSLRVLGELTATAGLEGHAVFSPGDAAVRHVGSSGTAPGAARPSATNPTPGVLQTDSEFIPLWEARFEDAQPYRVVRQGNEGRRVRIGRGGSGGGSMPSPQLFAPGNSVHRVGQRLLFLDHFQLRDHEIVTGRLRSRADGPLSERLRPGQPRARVAAYDQQSRVLSDDGQRLYAVVGTEKPVGDLGAILDNQLVAHDLETLEEIWTSKAHSALHQVTFLAAPTLSGSKLYVPILEAGTIALQCIDTKTGAPVYRVPVHRGGTNLVRPIASRVAIADGIAYLMSNAGALAAVDAYTGSLRWIRRYERVHPLRPKRLRETGGDSDSFRGNVVFSEVSRLPGFAPGEIIVVDGLVVFAPSDGSVLLCLDGATGEPVWMINRELSIPENAQVSRWKYIVGHDDRNLYLAGDQDLSCVSIRSGVRLWRTELPASPSISQWKGRGTVTSTHVLMPGERAIYAWPLHGEPGPDAPKRAWRRIALPDLSIGREPLNDEFNIYVDGVFLTAAYAGGVEVYSTVESLANLAERATDPLQKALLFAQSGDVLSAFETLEASDRTALDSTTKRRLAKRALALASELSLGMAAHSARGDALAILDRCRAILEHERDIMRWHLARIDVFQSLGDFESVESEQLTLYALMEGK